ncbi:MAG: DUF4157 domain-containing protein [Minicystis sp.]
MRLLRQCAGCREDEEKGPAVQRRAAPGAERAADEAPPIVDQVLQSGGGQPLDTDTRTFFEQRLGHDFSGVRIHTGARAAASARAVNALAYTVGQDIVFDAGRHAPRDEAGRKLLAHELTHVVQQRGGLARAAIQRADAPAPSGAPELDYNALVDQIYAASIDKIGTDEEAVYGALQRLQRNPVAVQKLIDTYQQRKKRDLLEDLDKELDSEELEYALQLLGRGKAGSKQRVEAAPSSPADFTAGARRIYAAVDGPGTDEEAIYAVLLPLNRDPTASMRLQNAYHSLYKEDLRDRLVDEMSGSQLTYALSLMETPYEFYLHEADERLAGVSFDSTAHILNLCSPEEHVSSSGKTTRDYWYDPKYWEPAGDEPLKSCKLQLRSGESAAKAIDEMFDNQSRWKVACAEFVQINHLYAMRHALGAKTFDARFGGDKLRLEIRRRESTGLKTKILYNRNSASMPMKRSSDGKEETRSVDEILADAPVGTRVRWTNSHSSAQGKPWENENTIKLGADKYAGQGLAEIRFPRFGETGSFLGFRKEDTYSRAEIELRSARAISRDADQEYVRLFIYISEIELFEQP